MTNALIGVIALVAMGLSLYQLSRPGLLFGISEYDDGAYFGSSIRLAHGALPYRDFVLVQPPGFTVLASPLAFLSRVIGTRDALAIARLCMPLVAALNVVLVGRLMRHRGLLATLVAAGLVAVFPAEVNATHTLLLEPLLDLFCVLGAVLVFDGDGLAGRRRLLIGGIALGFAGAIKGWALIPVLVICVLCFPQVRRRLAPFAGGVAIGFVVPTLPFAILAPASFYREVISTQLGRIAGSGRVPVATRLADLTGASSAAHGWVAIGVLTALAGVVVAAFVVSRRRPTSFEWFAIGSMVGVGALLLAPAEFYAHYAAFFAPFLAMVAGNAVGLLAMLRASVQRAALAVAAAGLVVLTASQGVIVHAQHASDVSRVIDAAIPAGACALADSPADLITTNRFVSAVPGCADNIADPYGTTISYGGRTPQAVDVWRHAFERSDYLVLYSLRNGRVPLVPSLRDHLARHFRLVRSGSLLIYVRNGFPTG